MKKSYLVNMVNISKNFGKVQALKNVNFAVNYSEVVGLLGDNGAGKSTLLKILVGFHKPDKGEIYFEGEKVSFSSPLEARLRGIEIVYQDFALVNLMSIARNFFLAREPTRKLGPFQLLDKEKMNKESEKVLKEIGVNIRSTEEAVSYLSGGERQAITIGRALYFGVKLLALDEPTANLSIKEASKVLDIIKQAKNQGISVIFVTHNVYHVYPVADKFVILDHGIKIAEYNREEVSPEDIIETIKEGKAIK
jgi:simple sugar transport system ATP-binding protein